VFSIYLPAADIKADLQAGSGSGARDDAGQAAGIVPQHGGATADASAKGGPRLLYVDDDESLVFLVTRLLSRRGYKVSGFTDQAEALAALRAAPDEYDLVLTDYNMPGMSGLDVAREVRAIRASLPVAVASGFIDETLRAEAAGAGVRELIFKADSVEEFCAAVQRLAETGVVPART
jgi:CheY-like chemotaxis protein